MSTTNLISKSLGNVLTQSGNGTPDHASPAGSLYSDKDRSVLANHKNKSLVIWGGKDMSYEKSLTLVKSLVDKKISATWVYPGFFSKILDNYNIKHKKIYIPIKDYNPFQPEVLGDKIYCYKGVLGNRGDYFKWNEIIKPLIDRYGLEKIIFTEKKWGSPEVYHQTVKELMGKSVAILDKKNDIDTLEDLEQSHELYTKFINKFSEREN